MRTSASKSTSPTPEARDKLFAAISTTSEPTAAAALAKLVQPPDRVSEAIALGYLEEAVEAGKLYAYPPKTAKGKRRYWDRDTAVLAEQAVADALPLQSGPFTTRELLKQLKAAVKLTEADVQPVLEKLHRASKLFAFPPATAKGGPRFSTQSPVEYSRQLILKHVEAKGPQPEATLTKLLKGFAPQVVDDVWQSLLSQQELYRHPAFGKVKKELFGKLPPTPGPYLKEIGSQLSKVTAVLLQANVPQSELRRAIIELAEGAGIRFQDASGTPRSSNTAAHVSEVPAQVQLINLIRKLEPGADRGALVDTPRLRKASGLNKQEFDAAILDLARKQRLVLHRHDFPASLSEQSRAELVFDGIETYFIGVALRNEG